MIYLQLQKLHFNQALPDLEPWPYTAGLLSTAPVFTGIALATATARGPVMTLEPFSHHHVSLRLVWRLWISIPTSLWRSWVGGPGGCAGRWLEIGPTCLKEVEPWRLWSQICLKIPFEVLTFCPGGSDFSISCRSRAWAGELASKRRPLIVGAWHGSDRNDASAGYLAFSGTKSRWSRQNT